MLDESSRAALGPPFSVAAARRMGVDPAHLRRAGYDAPFHGIRMLPAHEAAPELDRFGRPLRQTEAQHLRKARAFATAMSNHQFFVLATAAVIWGIPLPGHAVTDDIHLGVQPPNHLPRGRGYRGHEVQPKLASVVTDPRTGLRVTSPASTWAMLASVLRHPYDVVAAGDAVVRTWRVEVPLGTVGHLRRAMEAGRRVGVQRLRDALPLVRTRSASRPESWMRLTIVHAGLPEPELNFDVVEAGRKLACVDGAYPALKIALEYEGEQHLTDPEQWARDIRRYEELHAAGWIVIRVTKSALFGTPGEFIARVRRAISRRGSLP